MAQEPTIALAMEAMPQNINDRLTDIMDSFYRDELGSLPVRDISVKLPLETLLLFKTYQEKVYNTRLKEYQEAEKRIADEKHKHDVDPFAILADITKLALGIKRVTILPIQPEKISDEEALKAIQLVQRYLNSVTRPGQRPINLPPTVGRALDGFDVNTLHSNVVFHYLLEKWERRGVEEMVRASNLFLLKEIVTTLGEVRSMEKQLLQEDIQRIVGYLRQSTW